MGKNKILIIGYFGMSNLGSEVRLRVIIDDIRRAKPDAEITVATFSYNKMEAEKGVKYIMLRNVFTGVFELILFHIWRFDYIMNAEGIPFVDFCGKGFINFFVPVLIAAWLFRKKSISYAFDVDHLSLIDNALVRFALERTDMLVTRTKESHDVLKKMGLHHKVRIGSDCSFLFKPRKVIAASHRKKIGFCFKDFYCYPVKAKLFGRREHLYHYPFYYDYKDHGELKCINFKDNMTTLISLFLEDHPREELQFIINEPQMDEKITMEIYKSIPKHLRKRIEIVSGSTKSLDAMKQNYRNLKCLIAARYHAILLSLEYRVPSLALSTDERFDYILRELDLKKYLVDVYHGGIDMNRVLKFMTHHKEAKKEYKKHIDARYDAFVAKAKKNYEHLIEFFSE